MATRKKAPAEDAGKVPESQPHLLGKGRYAIYQTPEGDGVVVYRADGTDADERQVVPARFWSMLMGILSGELKNLSPVDLMKLLIAGGR